MYDSENKELASLLLYPYFIMIITPAGAGPEKIGATWGLDARQNKDSKKTQHQSRHPRVVYVRVSLSLQIKKIVQIRMI